MFHSAKASGFLDLENRLLAALTEEEYQRLKPELEPVNFELGKVIYQAYEKIEYLYFPTTSMISLLLTLEDGMTAEVGLTGKDGVVGVALVLGSDNTPNQAVVQIAGGALRLKARIVQEEFKRGGTFQKVLLLYTQTLLTQISQTAICNRLHPVEQRFCRWLLLSHDRVKSDVLKMTQELIASMLGGRRESVTVAAGRLQDAGLINYARGHITILNRQGLEESVCECYGVVKSEYERLLGWDGA
ncbi:MAG: Crp/Fnr family transcriptional regulator [Chloroflexi bacterium]|jgi:CRP-like cAMP-binding protein|nr:Crp/Fnr family transcriptional regulator [Chloroflexota bacterium]